MRPSFTLVWLIAISILFTVLMVVLGIESPHHVTGNLIIDDFYLSVSSLFLGGILDINGIGTEGYIVCLVEGVIGLLLMLYFTVILTRKFIR